MMMTIIIHKRDSKEQINKAIKKATGPDRKKIDLNKFFGKVDFGIGGLKYQKKVRDEWEKES